ncbi:MAG TPA: Uma2 family endonuclease [Vicinamibacterales bacterium]|nr:Uma2 family endonuclease [Vicinamibacterales bacterium]
MDKSERIATGDYLSMLETMRRRELVYGVVREPPAPLYGHQSIITKLTVRLDQHVRRKALGRVCVSPIDVVLDEEKALILQPDLIFVSNERLGIIRDQIWGAPDLVIEVASRGTMKYDRTTKLEWYRQYGVRECWIVNPTARRIDVVEFGSTAPQPRAFEGRSLVRSVVLPGLRLRVDDVFNC